VPSLTDYPTFVDPRQPPRYNTRMNNTHNNLPTDYTHPRSIAEMICEGFVIHYDAIRTDKDLTVVDLTEANYTNAFIVIHPNAWVTMPEGLPVEVYAALDLDIRAYWVDFNLNPTDPRVA
jgi:hypothetical protein